MKQFVNEFEIFDIDSDGRCLELWIMILIVSGNRNFLKTSFPLLLNKSSVFLLNFELKVQRDDRWRSAHKIPRRLVPSLPLQVQTLQVSCFWGFAVFVLFRNTESYFSVELTVDSREVAGELYCLRCHDTMGIPICGACHRPVEERVVTALGKHWHVEVEFSNDMIKIRNLTIRKSIFLTNGSC